jgi:hypothetical protein
VPLPALYLTRFAFFFCMSCDFFVSTIIYFLLMFFISSHPAQFSHFHWSFHELTSHHCGETLSYSAKAEAGEVNLSILFGMICMHPVSCYLIFISDIYKSGYHQCWQIGNYGYRFSF